MFQLTKEEYNALRYRIGTSKEIKMKNQKSTTVPVQGGRRYLPYIFTEQGGKLVWILPSL
jgi:ORF6N domain-containing protein